jgi:hypothetical protein
MSIEMAQFHQVFFEESFEGPDVMENSLLNMDRGKSTWKRSTASFAQRIPPRAAAGPSFLPTSRNSPM